ncbi:MAG: DUF72 domain-containing protein [Acidobacteriota bacterium]
MNFGAVPNLHLGTSSWSTESWVGPFYPPGTPPVEFLPVYASHYSTVEVDSTYYRIPSRKLVQGWYDRTPPGFIFAAKFPGEITHKKVLIDCERETEEFLNVMELLGEKLGPLLLQFPYLNQQVIAKSEDFLSRLGRYLERLPRSHRYAVEIRNRKWLGQPLIDLLRKHNVALALVDQAWMPTITQLTEKLDVLTTDFTYIRWIGDRKGIEEKTKTWEKIIVTASPKPGSGFATSANSSSRAGPSTPITTITTPAMGPGPSSFLVKSGRKPNRQICRARSVPTSVALETQTDAYRSLSRKLRRARPSATSRYTTA